MYRKSGIRYCWPAVLVSLTVLAVAACTVETPPPPVRTQNTPQTSEAPPSAGHGYPPTAAPGEVPEAPPAPSEVPAGQPEAPAEEPAQTALVGPTPAQLIGIDEQRTTALLGPAAAMEERAPATVWHYKGARCSLDLTFYMEMRSGRMRTLHAEFKGDAATPERRQACLKEIVEENRKAGPS